MINTQAEPVKEECCNDCDYEANIDNCFSASKDKSCLKRYFSGIRAGSLRGSTLALASITFGGGCLSFPYAVARSGPVIGLLIFLIIGFLSYLTLKYLLWNGLDSRLMHFNKLTTEAGGNNLRIAADICNLILCFGLIVSYEYILSNMLMQTLHEFFNYACDGYAKIIQIAVTTIFILIPLSSLKDIAKLLYLSIIGTVTLALSILVILGEFPFYLKEYIKSGKVMQLFPENLSTGWMD